ncbi:hypothetical protein HDU76_000986 [Blyttiomyces sp. JEL0837]|nr:hypothetical protein HDU76_000986 [Blyttiomyces sp. JEL0837]
MGGMRGADVWILRRDAEKGEYYIQDSYATDFALPQRDESQDVTLVSPPMTNLTSSTVYTIRRQLSTCDSHDIEIKKGYISSVVWAHGTSSTPSSISQHSATNRGDNKVLFYPDPTSPGEPVEPSDTQIFEIRMPNITVPPVSTSYLCSHFEFPADTKYHVIKYEGIPNSKFIHHMEIYSCISKPPSFGDLYDCSSMGSVCSEVQYLWAPGVPPVILPAEAGLPMGKGSNAKQYFTLQVHYSNPDLVENVTDVSGMRMYYTKQLRPSDVGVLTVGSVDIDIPGDSSEYTILEPNVCPSECTSKFSQPINVISTFNHMHTLGHNMSVQHIRGINEIEPISIRPFYDFNYQANKQILNTIIMPGDAIITTCTYKPTIGERTNTTKFGESTKQEMCLNIIQYYPKMENIDVCMSEANLGLALCSTTGKISANGWSGLSDVLNFTGSGGIVDTVTRMLDDGDIVPFAKPEYNAYQPQCLTSLQAVNQSGKTTKSDAAGVTVSMMSVALGVVALLMLFQ